MEGNFPSSGLVDSVTIEISSFLKKISIQLRTFSKIWYKKPFHKRDEEVYNKLLAINRKVSQIQNELTEIANILGEEIENDTISVPETVTISSREFFIMSEIFLRYTENIQEASQFSLFSVKQHN